MDLLQALVMKVTSTLGILSALLLGAIAIALIPTRFSEHNGAQNAYGEPDGEQSNGEVGSFVD